MDKELIVGHYVWYIPPKKQSYNLPRIPLRKPKPEINTWLQKVMRQQILPSCGESVPTHNKIITSSHYTAEFILFQKASEGVGFGCRPDVVGSEEWMGWSGSLLPGEDSDEMASEASSRGRTPRVEHRALYRDLICVKRRTMSSSDPDSEAMDGFVIGNFDIRDTSCSA